MSNLLPINLETLGIGEELKVSSVSLSGQEIKKSQSNNTNFAEWVEENFGDFKLEKLDEMIMTTPTGKSFTVSDFDNEGHFGHLSGKDENNNVFEDIEINNNIEE